MDIQAISGIWSPSFRLSVISLDLLERNVRPHLSRVLGLAKLHAKPSD